MPTIKQIFNPISGTFDSVTDVTDVEQRITNLSASNLGTGAGVYSSRVADDFKFKSLTAGQGIKTTASTNDITLESYSGYIKNNNFEFNTTGWVTYANTAGVAPVDGTGGSPNISFIRTPYSPLQGLYSGYLAKDAVNRQGQGVSYDFTVELCDVAQILNISFDYSTSANYVGGDIRVYIFDVGNNQIIEVIDRDLPANLFGKYSGSFQTSATGSLYRLIFHISSTNAAAYQVTIDNVVVGPQSIVKGPIVSDWEDYTPVIGGLGAGSTASTYGRYRRVGDTVEIQASFVKDATPGTGTAIVTFSMPSGLLADFNKVLNASTVGYSTIGNYQLRRGGTTNEFGSISVLNTSELFGRESGGVTTNVTGADITASTTYAINAFVPIAGWSSNTVLSEDAGNRQIVFRGVNGASTAVTANVTDIPFTTSIDTAASWNGSGFTAPESGFYDINGFVRYSPVSSNTIQSYINGSGNIFIGQNTGSTNFCSFSGSFYLNKGDFLSIRSTTSTTTGGSSISHWITVAKRSSPQTIAASEIVAATYTTNSGAGTTTGIQSTILYEDKVFDTHNAYNTSTGEYVVPSSGVYCIEAAIGFNNSSAWEIDESVTLSVFVNGVEKAWSYWECNVTSAFNWIPPQIPVKWLDSLSKGDIVTIRIFQNSDSSITINVNPQSNRFMIHKINGVA